MFYTYTTYIVVIYIEIKHAVSCHLNRTDSFKKPWFSCQPWFNHIRTHPVRWCPAFPLEYAQRLRPPPGSAPRWRHGCPHAEPDASRWRGDTDSELDTWKCLPSPPQMRLAHYTLLYLFKMENQFKPSVWLKLIQSNMIISQHRNKTHPALLQLLYQHCQIHCQSSQWPEDL